MVIISSMVIDFMFLLILLFPQVVPHKMMKRWFQNTTKDSFII